MAKLIRAQINPDMLSWARAQASFSLEDAARVLRIPVDRLAAWESGVAKPTIGQLRRIGKAYGRPTAFFYLEVPPSTPPMLADYRRLPESARELSPDLALEIRTARFRRGIAIEVSDIIGTELPHFELHAQIDDPPEVTGTYIRKSLNLPTGQQFEWRSEYEALAAWTEAIESIGALVFQFSGIEVAEARGFSIVDLPLPTISINGADSPNGRIFTLFHELAHLALRASGLCDLHETNSHNGLEAYCNAAAAQALVPAELLLAQDEVKQNPEQPFWADAPIVTLSSRFHVSREVILRRFLTLGLTTQSFYQTKRAEFAEAYKEITARRGGFLRYHKRIVRNNGPAYTSLVVDAYNQQAITAIDLSRYLGDIRINHLDSIQSELISGG